VLITTTIEVKYFQKLKKYFSREF